MVTDTTVIGEIELTRAQISALDAHWDHCSDWARINAPEVLLHVLAWATAAERSTMERDTRGILAFLGDHLELLSDADADRLFGRPYDLEIWAAERADTTSWADWPHP